jgi:hypothetical protein
MDLSLPIRLLDLILLEFCIGLKNKFPQIEVTPEIIRRKIIN